MTISKIAKGLPLHLLKPPSDLFAGSQAYRRLQSPGSVQRTAAFIAVIRRLALALKNILFASKRH
jgi:hypothetical protein